MNRLVPLILAGAAWAAPAAMAEPVGLEDAVRLALDNAPAISRAEAGVEASRAGIDAARARSRPQVGLRGEVGALETDFTTDQIGQVPRSIGLQGEWTVYASGANAAAESAARAMTGAAGSRLLGTRERIVLETFEAYALTWLNESVVEVARQRRETLRIRLDETTARFEQGQVTRTDVALTEARFASSEAGYEAARASLSAARARLSRLTGLDSPEPVNLPGLDTAPLADQATALARVLDRNPDLAAAENARRSADARVDEARGRFGPSVSLRARATHGEDVFFFFDDPISDVGAFVTVEVPLYTSGLRSASQREAYAGWSAADAGVRETHQALAEGVASLWADIDARRLALRAARRAEAAASLAAEGAQREYEAGLRTLVDALDAETGYRDAQISRARAEVDMRLAEARLLSLSADLEFALVH